MQCVRKHIMIMAVKKCQQVRIRPRFILKRNLFILGTRTIPTYWNSISWCGIGPNNSCVFGLFGRVFGGCNFSFRFSYLFYLPCRHFVRMKLSVYSLVWKGRQMLQNKATDNCVYKKNLSSTCDTSRAILVVYSWYPIFGVVYATNFSHCEIVFILACVAARIF